MGIERGVEQWPEVAVGEVVEAVGEDSGLALIERLHDSNGWQARRAILKQTGPEHALLIPTLTRSAQVTHMSGPNAPPPPQNLPDESSLPILYTKDDEVLFFETVHFLDVDHSGNLKTPTLVTILGAVGPLSFLAAALSVLFF